MVRRPAIAAAQLDPPFTILLSGWYGHDNTGDEAILQQFIQEMAESGDIRLEVLCGAPEQVQALHGRPNLTALRHQALIGRSALWDLLCGRSSQQIHAIRHCDLFVLGGGGLLRDNTGYRNLLYLLDEIWLCKLAGAKVALYAIGAGPWRTRLGTWLIRKSLALCDLITVREEFSRQQLIQIGVPGERVIVTADPGLLIEPERPDHPEVHQLLASLPSDQLAGVYMTGDSTPIPELAEALDALHGRRGWQFLAVPLRCHAGEDDRWAARQVRQRMQRPESLHLLESRLRPSEVRWLAGQFRLNITIRLHAMIFSLAALTPVVAIRYEQKIEFMLRSFGLEECLVSRAPNLAETLVDRALACETRRAEYQARIRQALAKQRQMAQRNFVLLRALRWSHLREGTSAGAPGSSGQ